MGHPLLSAIGVVLGAAVFCVGVVAVPPLSGLGMLILAASILLPFMLGSTPAPTPVRAANGGNVRQVNTNNQRNNNRRRR